MTDAKRNETPAEIKSRARKIVGRLKREYPDAVTSLKYKTPHQLLVATVLSAQSTDEQVNKITGGLFKKYRKPEDFANAPVKGLENDIRSIGLFRNKAKAIKESARMIVDEFGGTVPQELSELVRLPGVGRKTASVILGAAFNRAEGVVVDTHVARLSKRLGLTGQKNAEKIEKDLMDVIPKKDWILFSHMMIDHGRAVCKARKPECGKCILAGLCPSAFTF
jgi:endonuclease-3